MKIPSKLSLALGVVAVFAATFACAYPGENITLDPVSGNYIITYWDDSTEDSYGRPIKPRLKHTTFVPATKIIPSIRSKFWPNGEEYIRYGYTLFNGKAAKQSIVRISIEQVGRIVNEQTIRVKTATDSELESAIFANMSALISPENWSGNIYREQSRIVWQSDDLETEGVHAGHTQSGFGFQSSVLPGISEARIEGLGAVFGFAGSGPAEDSSILEELARLENSDFVLRRVAAPTIAVPTPFNAAMLMDRIRAEMLTWTGKQLLDPAFATQLDRYMIAAADAYRRNQTKAGKEHVETLREMLKREHKYLDHDEEDNEDTPEHKAATRFTIDRLAARVLDFDLRYVLKRTEREHEEGERKKGRD